MPPADRRPQRAPSPALPRETDPGRLVVGLQPVREAIRVHGSHVIRVAADARGSARVEALVRFAQDQGIERVERRSRAELDRLSAGVTHQGVVAWAPPLRLLSLAELLETKGLLGVVLDGIQDPQNFGAVVRSAVALAAAPVIWPEHSSAPLTPATFRASAGAIEHARLCRVSSLVSALQQATDAGVQVVALEPRTDRLLWELDLTVPTLLVVGSEHEGIGRAARRACAASACLVPPGSIDSLNASVAAALGLYEAAKQRLSSRG
jgi:23S rRNA (guanosine2251-2'-O)-methyltransferase